MSEPADAPMTCSAAELAAAVRVRERSPVELVDAAIAAIEARDPTLNAIVHRGFDDARAAARRAEAAVMAGEPLGPLHGVPTAMKDLFDFKPGWPSTLGGIPALRGQIATGWCPFAQRVEAAGAIIVGKGNSPAMGFRGTCDNRLFGPTANPFDPRLNAGGSSGGCAAAVADGMLPFAEGSDGGGSIRIPAAWCGVYGFKPSFGRVPSLARPNAFASTDPFLFEGPIARTVGDAALVLGALAGHDPRDPFSLDAPLDLSPVQAGDVAGLRVGYTPDFGGYPVDRRIRAVLDEAVGAFEAAGAHVEPADLRLPADQRELSDLWCRLILPANVAGVEGLKAAGIDLVADHPDDLSPEYLAWLERGRALTAQDAFADGCLRTAVLDAFLALFERFDLLVGPTVCAMPVPNASDGNTVGPSRIEGVDVDPLIGWCPTYLVNFIGHPAASLPAGLADGLPVGLQVIGRRSADVEVLKASAAFERVRPWRHTYAALADRPLAAG